MNAEIICVGTELLLGDIVNTNAAAIAKNLAKIGVNVYHHTVVGDNPQRLKKSLEDAYLHGDVVVTTGGLGPTYDDLTKETIAEYFNRPLIMNEQALAGLKSFFDKTGREMTKNNEKQAMFPEGAIILENPNGTAPGCIIEGENNKIAIMMPGPPREMVPMLENQVCPYLENKFGHGGVLVSKTLNFFGIGESTLEHQLKELMLSSQNPTIAPYAKTGECQLRITARADTAQQAQELIAPVANLIKEQFPNEIYGEDYNTLNHAVVDIYNKKGLTFAVAESCTGGLVASRIVELSGASKVFLGGVIAYSNQVKVDLLKVKAETIANFGAVSKECAIEMAEGMRAATNADFAVATTGVAGPEGGTERAPVGRVYVAIVGENVKEVRELNLARGRADDRESVRNSAACNAYHMLVLAAK